MPIIYYYAVATVWHKTAKGEVIPVIYQANYREIKIEGHAVHIYHGSIIL